MKKCYICKEKKALKNFSIFKKSPDGHGAYCKKCAIKKSGEWLKKKGAEYSVWCEMKSRCSNPNNNVYKHYGGRGISVCSRWNESFEKFLQDMGRRPTPKHSIDRMDNNGNYEIDNCRWSTQDIQTRNTRTRKDNTSGHRGVTWYKGKNKWRATINANKINYSLGYFENKEDAIKARKEAELKYWNTKTL